MSRGTLRSVYELLNLREMALPQVFVARHLEADFAFDQISAYALPEHDSSLLVHVVPVHHAAAAIARMRKENFRELIAEPGFAMLQQDALDFLKLQVGLDWIRADFPNLGNPLSFARHGW
jgi:hypothetical protein